MILVEKAKQGLLLLGAALIAIFLLILYKGSLTYVSARALQNMEWRRAAQVSRLCVDADRAEADEIQARLHAEGAELPPTGAVEGDRRWELLRRGALNNVALCLFVGGRAEEELQHPERAAEAYRSLASYTHARVWDPRGFFWDPTAAARERQQEREPR